MMHQSSRPGAPQSVSLLYSLGSGMQVVTPSTGHRSSASKTHHRVMSSSSTHSPPPSRVGSAWSQSLAPPPMSTYSQTLASWGSSPMMMTSLMPHGHSGSTTSSGSHQPLTQSRPSPQVPQSGQSEPQGLVSHWPGMHSQDGSSQVPSGSQVPVSWSQRPPSGQSLHGLPQPSSSPHSLPPQLPMQRHFSPTHSLSDGHSQVTPLGRSPHQSPMGGQPGSWPTHCQDPVSQAWSRSGQSVHLPPQPSSSPHDLPVQSQSTHCPSRHSPLGHPQGSLPSHSSHSLVPQPFFDPQVTPAQLSSQSSSSLVH